MRIGKKIWQNECGGTIAGLTSWNAGENFASLGIGHFIWYPKGVRGPFEESFPKFVAFAARTRRQAAAGRRCRTATACPWKSRAEFLAASKVSGDEGIAPIPRRHGRSSGAIPGSTPAAGASEDAGGSAPVAERAKIEQQFERVASTPQGCYALVDYVNFKGEGRSRHRALSGQGWGLLQVLEGMTGSGNGAARRPRNLLNRPRNVLTQRVQNSPPERNESRWLPGWLKRVNSYTKVKAS